MRIVGGSLKGRSLVAPGGRQTRPTSDRAREAVFNILAHAEWAPSLDGASVIDLFAGSGALGFEAISRGAAFCLFVETDEAARGCIRENIDALGLFGSTRVHRRDATQLGPKPSGLGAPFDFAFLDPPYRAGLVEKALMGLCEGPWLQPHAIIVAETASDEPFQVPDRFAVLDERVYGAAKVWFLSLAEA